jgi:PleD family two-component response regulator
MDDERVDAAISSFLSGPQHRRGRREAAVANAIAGNSPIASATNGFAALETRIAWMEALRREAARSTRYRRPAAVLVLAAVPNVESVAATAWLGRVAGPIAHALHRGIRDTDLVTRTGDARFQVLLPETAEPEARQVADRVVMDCQVWLQAVAAPLTVRAATAATAPDSTLEMALERALKAMELDGSA